MFNLPNLSIVLPLIIAVVGYVVLRSKATNSQLNKLAKGNSEIRRYADRLEKDITSMTSREEALTKRLQIIEDELHNLRDNKAEATTKLVILSSRNHDVEQGMR